MKDRMLTRSLAAGAIVALTAVAPAYAAHDAMVFNGIVTHVSGDNLKVRDPKSGQTVGFALAKGLKPLHPGQYVKVIYDRKFLGVAHADRVYVLNQANAKVKTVKN